MLTIIQKPASLNYSLNLPDLIVESTDPELSVIFYRDGIQLLEETYQTNQDHRAIVRMDELIHSLLTVQVPSYNSGVHIQEHGKATFFISISDNDENETLTFDVIKGFRSVHPGDIPGYFRNNWLTAMPQISEVTFHQPLFLTAYVDKAVTVKAEFTLPDNATQTIDLYTLTAGALQTINLNPGKLIQHLGSEYKSVSLYGMEGTDRYFFTQTFILQPREAYAESHFLFENRLGGIDTLKGIGEESAKHSFESKLSTARYRDVAHSLRRTSEIRKNTGAVTTLEQENQIIEFLYSPAKYVSHAGEVHEIHVTSADFNPVKGSLSEFSFTYTYADRRLIYPELEIKPYHLNA